MRKTMSALAGFVLVSVVLVSVVLAGTAQAQDTVIGTVVADPATVPEAGEYTFTATGSDYLPNTSVLIVACVSPAEPLVPGESSEDDVVAAAQAIDALADCDVAFAQNVEVDEEGGWTAELTAEVGDNFFLSAGALDGSQAGATWVPIVATDATADEGEAEDELADTGIETGLLAVIGVAVLGAGTMIAREGRRIRS